MMENDRTFNENSIEDIVSRYRHVRNIKLGLQVNF